MWEIVKSVAEVIGAIVTVVTIILALWQRSVFRSELSIETIDPVYWSEQGCPIQVEVLVNSGDYLKYKVVVFQRNTKESANQWHFQFEKPLLQKRQVVNGFIWYGSQYKGDREDYEVAVIIMLKDEVIQKEPSVHRLDLFEVKAIKIESVTRKDSNVS